MKAKDIKVGASVSFDDGRVHIGTVESIHGNDVVLKDIKPAISGSETMTKAPADLTPAGPLEGAADSRGNFPPRK